MWTMKNDEMEQEGSATRQNQVCPDTALAGQVGITVILHFGDGEGF